jgi:DNA-binding NtrC family response regulator
MESTLELPNRKTILVVDDDADLLKSVSESLADTYSVLTANSGEAGLQPSKDFKSEIHALLSGSQMAGMTGIGLATQVTAQRPKIKVLLMSGYSSGMLNEEWRFLPKPFITSQLRALIVALVSPDKPSRFAA